MERNMFYLSRSDEENQMKSDENQMKKESYKDHSIISCTSDMMLKCSNGKQA